jgi:NtrC-family two-component system sensor histidine kinase KinB
LHFCPAKLATPLIPVGSHKEQHGFAGVTHTIGRKTADTASDAAGAVLLSPPPLVVSPAQESSISGLSYDELLRAYSQVQKKAEVLTVAMASAAHELKTPLAIMSGYLELLVSEKVGPTTPRQQRVLRAMQASGIRLQQFIEDFLTYSALETGKMPVELAVDDLNARLAELCEMWSPRFQEKGVALYFPVNKHLPQFTFDSHKVQRVASILLENAYLWTASGATVWITAELHLWDRRVRQAADFARERRQQLSSAPNAVRISVSDNGPGIAPEYHQEIFEDFVSRRPRTSHATGLGLAIARRLVHAQRGTIWVESELGVGSRFSFLLPLKP